MGHSGLNGHVKLTRGRRPHPPSHSPPPPPPTPPPTHTYLFGQVLIEHPSHGLMALEIIPGSGVDTGQQRLATAGGQQGVCYYCRTLLNFWMVAR